MSDNTHENSLQDPAPPCRKGSSADKQRKRRKNVKPRRQISPALLTAISKHQNENAPDLGRKQQRRHLSSPLAVCKSKHNLRTPHHNRVIVPLQSPRSPTAQATTEPPQKLQQPRNCSWTHPPTPEQRSHISAAKRNTTRTPPVNLSRTARTSRHRSNHPSLLRAATCHAAHTVDSVFKTLIVCMTMKRLQLNCSLHLVEVEDDHNERTTFTLPQFQIATVRPCTSRGLTKLLGERDSAWRGERVCVRWCADKNWKEPDLRQRCE